MDFRRTIRLCTALCCPFPADGGGGSVGDGSFGKNTIKSKYRPELGHSVRNTTTFNILAACLPLRRAEWRAQIDHAGLYHPGGGRSSIIVVKDQHRNGIKNRAREPQQHPEGYIYTAEEADGRSSTAASIMRMVSMPWRLLFFFLFSGSIPFAIVSCPFILLVYLLSQIVSLSVSHQYAMARLLLNAAILFVKTK